jgi:hypothetical protein
MARVDTADLMSISEANKLGVAALARDAAGRERVLLRNNKPVAAVVGIERLERMQQLEDDLADIALATARLLTDTGERTSLDDALQQFGYTREQLLAEPD